MLYRRYDWTDPEALELAKQFVTVAVEHRTWQESLATPEQWFPGFLDRAGMQNYEPEDGHGANALVGLFALRPDGTQLAVPRTTTESPTPKRDTAEFLQAALEAWDGLSPEERTYDAAVADYPRPPSPWEAATNLPAELPPNRVVLQSWIRDLPREDKDEIAPEGAEIRRKGFFRDLWNTDFAWFEDPAAWLPENPKVGDVYSVPRWAVERLVRFHLVDNVAGLTRSFERDHVEIAEIRLAVVAASADRVEMVLSGQTRAAEAGEWQLSQTTEEVATTRGFETTIHGRATWLHREERFERLEFLAKGTRWGGTAQNRRFEVEFPPTSNDLAPAPIGLWFELYTGPEEKAIPPFFTWRGRSGAVYWAR